MECLLGFVTSFSRDLVCGALNQLRYPCCFKNFVKRLEEEESNLIITKDSVQKFVTHDKKQARKPSEIVDKWLEDAINDVHNVNQLLEEARTKKHCCFGHCPNWIWRYHVGKKLANKTMDLEKFIEKGRKYVPFDRIATLPSNTLDMLSEKCMNFESRQYAYEQLLDAVKNSDVSMIGLYGMGGCGKTTLAMEVRKLVEAEHIFEKVLFIAVSSTVEVRRIQEKIASSLQFEFPETEEMQRAQRLCSRLTQEKNIFIILDDVWEKLDFGRIGIPSFEHHKGCKIFITTRSEAVCTLMDCQRKIYLPILTDEEAWTLFQNKALISEGTPHTLKNLGRLISNECKGLPVAIAAVACSLKGKTETIWSVALNKLRRSKPINIERGLIDPYKCLQLSYDNLDTKEAKSLFLLCSVFPEDSEIQVEILTRCAIRLGVVGEVDSYEEARSEVIAAKIKLVSCCLLLDGDNERVKMHDIVRDVAHIIAQNENKKIKCEVEIDVTVEQNSVKYLWCSKFPNDLDCSNLEFLCLHTIMKGFEGIFKRMGKLKVLLLGNDEDEKTPLSTTSLKTLTNLRDLFIFNFELSDFSFLSGMKNLQTLSLYDCSLPSFPEFQTDVAITLKLLELNECYIKVKNFEVMKRIPLLEELYIIDITGEWYANSEDNIEFFKTFSIPKTLQRYGIVLGSDNFYHYNDRDIYIHSRTLLLNHFDISKNEVIKGLAKKAKDLFVRNIHGGAKNMIPDIFEIEGGGLNDLNTLEIRDSAGIKCLIDTRSHSSEVVTLFSKLHTLEMKRMENLKAIWHCFLPANGPFENLENLYLSNCPRLTFLFTYVVARNLVQLKILKISGCDELKHILTYDEKSQDEFTTGHPIQIFQNLLDVKIKRCRELKHIFPANIVGGLTQLKVLEIRECDMLDQIIGDIVPLTEQDRKQELDEIVEEGTLPSLTSLKITYCGKLDSIFTASKAKTLTSLEELFIEDCKSLKDIVTHERVNKNQEESIVEDEHISECDSLEVVFPNWTGPKNSLTLQHLTILTIWKCGNMEVIFPKSVVRCLPELKKVTIRECMELKQIIEEDESNLLSIDGGFEVEEIIGCDKEASKNYFAFPNLEKLEIIECEKLEVVFPKSILRCLPKLKLLKISQCKELSQIIEEDKNLSNILSPQPCFPKLEALHVDDCHKLKRLFSGSASNDLPNLHLLAINGTYELEELVGCKQGKTKVELPRLKLLIFMHLPNFRQEIELRDLKNCIIYKCPKLSLTSTTTLEKLLEDFPHKDFIHTELGPSELKGIVRSIYEYSTFNGSSEFTSSQEIEVVGNENIEEGPLVEGSKTKSSSTGVEDIGIGSGVEDIGIYEDSTSGSSELTSSQEIEDVGNESIKSSSTGVEDIGIGGATHIESGGEDILALDSKVVEQDDKMNEGKPGIVASQGIQVQEGLNLLHKQDGTDVVPNNNIDISSDICTRLGAYKHFADLDDAQISLLVEAITTYPHLWNASKKFSERFQAWRLKILADMLLFLQKESVDSIIPQREKEFHKLCEEAIEIGFESSWVEEMRQRVVARDPKLEEDIAKRQMDENSKSLLNRCSSGDVVEEGDGPKIRLEEGSDLVDKEGEVGVVSNDHILAPRNEEPEHEFVAEVSTSEIPRIATSLTNSQTVEKQTPSHLYIPVRETSSNALVDTKQTSEPCLMKQKKPLGEIPKSIDQVVEEETIAKNTDMAASSILSDSTTSKLDTTVTLQRKSHPHSEIRSSQNVVRITKESEGHLELIQDFGGNDMIAISLGKEGDDNIVVKTLVELENYLKMSLKDIVSSETNALRLFSTLNFLSNLPFKDVTLSDRLKHIIKTMHQHFPTILCSFKQRFATTDKLAELEARQNEVAIKIFEAENFNDEARLKEVVLKEEIIRLKEEIKVCEAALSSLDEGKNKCIVETIRYKKELENVRKNKSQMVKDQRKVEQELFEVAYKWSVLCSEYELNRIAARNPS
ncbi:uncharacterized protein LOC106777812 isoform X2 [Vigna radiata var. radiata]|uniref:Uncharacterized protein LOC106777812 isoform X2 n=1 Tax=Vigna radiata var. radiata TaxID=3916 RepID=A0A1S3VRY8_VIGRR|nr:uncharacterized protein LOC106777812 isoform X2 [Vigna radiata var. radiata]